jgi:hypothetical protein
LMRFHTANYAVSSFLIAAVLIAYTALMTVFIVQEGVELKSLLIVYTNIVFICITVQMHVSSRIT